MADMVYASTDIYILRSMTDIQFIFKLPPASFKYTWGPVQSWNLASVSEATARKVAVVRNTTPWNSSPSRRVYCASRTLLSIHPMSDLSRDSGNVLFRQSLSRTLSGTVGSKETTKVYAAFKTAPPTSNRPPKLKASPLRNLLNIKRATVQDMSISTYWEKHRSMVSDVRNSSGQIIMSTMLVGNLSRDRTEEKSCVRFRSSNKCLINT
jgi:hypothetical protein